MKYVTFTQTEKASMFDEIASHFYNANFGQISKSDFELMMFDFYMKKLIEKNQNEDGTIDYNKCSDYKISKELGITQQKVRNLKIKNQLVHPIKFEWEKSLAHLTQNARFDKNTKKVTLNIPDPNLYIEIQNFIEETGAYIEKQLNSKILELRVEYYIELILHLEPEESRKRIIKNLKKHFDENSKDEKKFNEREIGKSLIELGVNITSIIGNLTSEITPGNMIGSALIELLSRELIGNT